MVDFALAGWSVAQAIGWLLVAWAGLIILWALFEALGDLNPWYPILFCILVILFLVAWSFYKGGV